MGWRPETLAKVYLEGTVGMESKEIVRPGLTASPVNLTESTRLR